MTAQPTPLPCPIPTVDGRLAAAVSAIDEASLLPLVREVLAIPSETGSAAESAAQHALAARMDEAGLATDLWPIDLAAVTADPDFPGSEAARDEAWGLVGSWGGQDGPTLVLNGHIDVVPVGDLQRWTRDPWAGEVRSGRLYGRGACDMKGSLVGQLVAVRALRDAGVRLRGQVQLHSVVGEEDGGLGAFATLRRGYRGDLAVIGEPTAGAVVPAQAGALTFRLTVTGRSAHACVRTRGVDAVDLYLRVHAGLRALEVRRNRTIPAVLAHDPLPYPLSVGTVRAGSWASSVPEQLVAEGRLGVALGEPVAHARAELERAVAEICADDPWLAEHPVLIEWFGGQFASGEVPVDAAVTRAVGAAYAAVHGAPPAVRGVAYGSDLRLYTAAGIPTVLYGPGTIDDAHAPDESVAVSELVAAARTYAVLVASACGTSD